MTLASEVMATVQVRPMRTEHPLHSKKLLPPVVAGAVSFTVIPDS